MYSEINQEQQLEVNKKAKQEPVAWMVSDDVTEPELYQNYHQACQDAWDDDFGTFDPNTAKVEPLYTHPQKELSDAEIMTIASNFEIDAEISLAVAKIMYPEYEWQPWGGVAISDHDGMEFLHTDKDCAWDMAVWLAERADGGTWLTVGELLQTKNNPQRYLAMMVLEIGQSNE